MAQHHVTSYYRSEPGELEVSTTERIKIPEKYRDRFDRIKAECETVHLPEPSDEQMLESLMDTWDAVKDGQYASDCDV